eukprot:TRINITY_DN9880_c0_g1_i1.p1 TRINITY_DN9880_c0_g1~~TRINITY_DN9880_c0_g1_i1.p1  ORF type:complete len:144 (+),score=15.41 TRINITY_DN9880_c0_g1_i1:2-433(+)
MSDRKTDPDTLDEMREGFKTIAKGKATIGVAEVGALMRWLGQNPSGQELMDVMSGKQSLSFDDFCRVAAGRITEASNPDDIIEAFVAFDKDGRGCVSSSDLRHILTGMGDRLDEDQVEEMLSAAVHSGEGQLSYASFVQSMMK